MTETSTTYRNCGSAQPDELTLVLKELAQAVALRREPQQHAKGITEHTDDDDQRGRDQRIRKEAPGEYVPPGAGLDSCSGGDASACVPGHSHRSRPPLVSLIYWLRIVVILSLAAEVALGIEVFPVNIDTSMS